MPLSPAAEQHIGPRKSSWLRRGARSRCSCPQDHLARREFKECILWPLTDVRQEGEPGGTASEVGFARGLCHASRLPRLGAELKLSRDAGAQGGAVVSTLLDVGSLAEQRRSNHKQARAAAAAATATVTRATITTTTTARTTATAARVRRTTPRKAEEEESS